MKTSHDTYWPRCYRTQADAGLPDGPVDYPDPDDHRLDRLDMFAIGWGIGLLLGLALPDLVLLTADLLP